MKLAVGAALAKPSEVFFENRIANGVIRHDGSLKVVEIDWNSKLPANFDFRKRRPPENARNLTVCLGLLRLVEQGALRLCYGTCDFLNFSIFRNITHNRRSRRRTWELRKQDEVDARLVARSDVCDLVSVIARSNAPSCLQAGFPSSTFHQTTLGFFTPTWMSELFFASRRLRRLVVLGKFSFCAEFGFSSDSVFTLAAGCDR